MAKLKRKYIENNAVNGSKIRLDNDEYLRSRNAADTADVDILKVDTSNDVVFASVPKITGTPSDPSHVASVSYVQNLLEGLDPKEAVRVASTTNISSLSGLLTIDGVTLSAGDRVLVKNQTNQKENGIYIASAGAWSRSSDMNVSGEFPGAYTVVREGATQAAMGFVCNVPSSFVLGTDDVTFILFKAATDLIAGDGISVSGQTVAVDLATDPGLEFHSAKLRVKVDPAGAIKREAAGIGVKLESLNPTLQIISNELGVKIFSGSGLEASSSGLGIKLEASNPSLQISSNELGLKIHSSGALESVASGVRVRTDNSTTKINTSNNLESLKHREEIITLTATDISNGYIDLSHTAHGLNATNNSVSVYPIGGILQEKGVDYTVSLTGGSGGVTRISFIGDLASLLVAGDKLMISYNYLT